MNSKTFPYRAILSCVLDEMFIEMPLFLETLRDLKNHWLRLWDIETSEVENLIFAMFKFQPFS